TRWIALRKRYDRYGVGTDCPADASATSSGPSQRGGLAHDSAGDSLHSVHRMPVAGTAEGVPPYSTVQGYFYAWRDTGRWQKIVEALVRKARRKLGRKSKPTAAATHNKKT